MRTDSVKKYVIPNIPYLFILWACLKLGTAYRLASGADFAHKLMGLGQSIGPAFADFAPGLHPLDWRGFPVRLLLLGAVMLPLVPGQRQVATAGKAALFFLHGILAEGDWVNGVQQFRRKKYVPCARPDNASPAYPFDSYGAPE